jgi:hypothetical protein
MFKKLFRKLSGVVTYQELIDDVSSSLSKTEENKDLWLKDLSSERFDDSLFSEKEWLEDIKPEIEAISRLTKKDSQTLKVRELIIEFLDKSIQAKYYLLDKNKEDDLKLLNKSLNKVEAHFPESHKTYSKEYLEGSLGVFCLREISSRFYKDASKYDYFNLLVYVSEQYCDHTFGLRIAREKDDVYVMEALIPTIKHHYEEMKKNVANGLNYDSSNFDKAEEEVDIDEEKEEEDHVPVVDSVSEEQLFELLEYLEERIRRTYENGLYRIGDKFPQDPQKVLRVDTALMLIGISECVSDGEIAKNAIRRVLFEYIIKLDVPDEKKKDLDVNSIPIEEEEVLLDAWISNKDDGPLASTLLVITMLLYEISGEDYENLTSIEKEDLGKMAFGLMKDAWEVYATTKNVFGYDIDPGFS